MRELQPGWDILTVYKREAIKSPIQAQLNYVEKYRNKLRSQFTPEELLNKLSYQSGGKDLVMLCYEGRGKFCHRIEIARFLKSLINVEEL